MMVSAARSAWADVRRMARLVEHVLAEILSLVLGRVPHQPADVGDLEPPARFRS